MGQRRSCRRAIVASTKKTGNLLIEKHFVLPPQAVIILHCNNCRNAPRRIDPKGSNGRRMKLSGGSTRSDKSVSGKTMASETIKSKGDLSKGSLNCRNPPGHRTCSCADRDNVRVRSPRSLRLARSVGKSGPRYEKLETAGARLKGRRPFPARYLGRKVRKSTAAAGRDGVGDPCS
jgi:hypothetical protein